MKAMQYELEPIKKVSPKAVLHSQRKNTLESIGSLSLVWYLVRRHEVELLILLVAVEFVYILVSKLG